MGYSCSAKAHKTLKQTLNKANQLPLDNYNPPNTWENNGSKYFFERGREQQDGSITGTIYQFINNTNMCRKYGSVKILPNGIVKTWAGMAKHKIVQPAPVNINLIS